MIRRTESVHFYTSHHGARFAHLFYLLAFSDLYKNVSPAPAFPSYSLLEMPGSLIQSLCGHPRA
jgi:hypothetical protein